jgi:tRNA threonylcarbamoyladenosine biosynthesis protein TsaB
VAVLFGSSLVAAADLGAPGRQAEKILAETDRILREVSLSPKDIDLYAVTIGPGSFTGLRIGIAVAQGLGFGAGRPVVGVGSLLVLAAWAHEVTEGHGKLYVPLIDARRTEVYHAAYRIVDADFEERLPPAVCKAGELGDRLAPALERLEAAGEGPVVLCGDGVPAVGAELASWGMPFKTVFWPRSADAARLTARLGCRIFEAEGAPGIIEPLYIRPPDARKPLRPLRRGSSTIGRVEGGGGQAPR